MAVVLLSALLSFTVIQLALAQTEYQNAEGEKGKCVKIDNCPTVYSLFNSEPLSALTVEFPRRSKCKFDESKQLVCCEEAATDTSTGADEQPSAGFDLKTHPKASLLPLDSCGLDRERVWQGRYVKLDEFPWTAIVKFRDASNVTKLSCGGTLINKRYVLTAAQCTRFGTLRPNIMVRLGENDRSSDRDCETDVFSGRLQCAPPPQDFGTEEVIQHPEFVKKYYQHDITLIRLDRDAKLDTKYVKPICLPTTADVETGKELLLAGWGNKYERKDPQFKIKVEIPVVSTEECRRKISHVRIERQLCAGGVAGRDSCFGDAGMPLMDWTESLKDGSRRYSAVGLASHGSGCGAAGWPSVYTKVFHYVPWILENIRP